MNNTPFKKPRTVPKPPAQNSLQSLSLAASSANIPAPTSDKKRLEDTQRTLTYTIVNSIRELSIITDKHDSRLRYLSRNRWPGAGNAVILRLLNRIDGLLATVEDLYERVDSVLPEPISPITNEDGEDDEDIPTTEEYGSDDSDEDVEDSPDE